MPVLVSRGMTSSVSYKQTVLADSPLAYWRCNDTAASRTMTASVGTDATLVANASTFTTAGALTTDADLGFVVGSAGLGSVALNLSAYNHIAVEFWMYWTAFANDDKLALEFGNPTYVGSNGIVIDPNSSATSTFMCAQGGATVAWRDQFPRPSAAIWHHYVFDFDRSGLTGVSPNRTGTVTNTAYVDGVSQSLTADGHSLLDFGTDFGNSTLYVGSRTNSTLIAASGTKYDEIAIYGGGLSAAQVKNHYSAATWIGQQSILTGAIARSSNW